MSVTCCLTVKRTTGRCPYIGKGGMMDRSVVRKGLKSLCTCGIWILDCSLPDKLGGARLCKERCQKPSQAKSNTQYGDV